MTWRSRTTNIRFSIAGAARTCTPASSPADPAMQASSQMRPTLLVYIGLTGRYLNRAREAHIDLDLGIGPDSQPIVNPASVARIR
jgi:hypothetical protein